MLFANNSPIAFTESVGGWRVIFTARESEMTQTWEERVLGWAVVKRHEDDEGRTETVVEPVVLDEGTPVTVSAYLTERAGFVYWSVQPT